MGEKASIARRDGIGDEAFVGNEGGDAGLVEVSGAIKWFDVAKGYGFILPDGDSLGDVLIHVTCLRRDGFLQAALKRRFPLLRQTFVIGAHITPRPDIEQREEIGIGMRKAPVGGVGSRLLTAGISPSPEICADDSVDLKALVAKVTADA